MPGGTATWTFAGGHATTTNQSGTAAVAITKADGDVTYRLHRDYDAAAHGVTGSATGVDAGGAARARLDLGASFTNVPGGTANWTFTGGTNYNDQSGTAAIVINKADGAVTVNGYIGHIRCRARRDRHGDGR